jgi:hypothetical protein
MNCWACYRSQAKVRNYIHNSRRKAFMCRCKFASFWFSLSVLAIPLRSAYSQTVLDQQQTQYDSGISARSLVGYQIGQSFTARVSGTLTEIDVGFFNPINGIGTISVYSGQGNSGTLIDNTLVSVKSSSIGSLNWNAFTVNAPSAAGQQYTFLFTPYLTTIPDPYGIAAASGNPYLGGASVFIDPSGAYIETAFDLDFKTYVSVPEPSTMDAVCFGLLFLRRRGRAYSPSTPANTFL